MRLEDEDRVIKAGTNEFKLIEFFVADIRQGINLIKIKKIIKCVPDQIRFISGEHPAVWGVQEVDGVLVTMIDLRIVYGFSKVKDVPEQSIIITEFNRKRYGFIVDRVERVHRLSWNYLKPLGEFCPSNLFIGIASLSIGDILMTDFESIIDSVYPKALTPNPDDKGDNVQRQRRSRYHVICADDSLIIRKHMEHTLSQSGFADLKICADGLEAWQYFEELSKKTGFNHSKCLVITDIEMPQMDGFVLCKRIKERYPMLAVIIVSSLISDQIKLKCQEVNADLAISKDSLAEIVSNVDAVINRNRLFEKGEA